MGKQSCIWHVTLHLSSFMQDVSSSGPPSYSYSHRLLCPLLRPNTLQGPFRFGTSFPFMFLLKDTRETRASYKVFEDNSGALELARLPKLCSRTKHINMCCHHFREPMRSRLIKIYPVSTHDQVAYTLTKTLSPNTSQKHRRAMCGQ